MPLARGGRPLKRWRYVGVYGPELSLCVASAQIGPLRQAFWAVWDRAGGRLHERTVWRRGRVRLDPGRVLVDDRGVRIDLELREDAGIEVVCPHGRQYVWTRKQAGVPARGTVEIDGTARTIALPAVVDDTAGYHARETAWMWSAGAGVDPDGAPVAWNLVTGVNDPRHGSERAVWTGGSPREVGPVSFAADLSSVGFAEGGKLSFEAEAVRRRDDNLLLVKSEYEQPFGRFTGTLPGGIVLAEAFGVMERHTAAW
jgi:hypothetical protein